MGNGIKGEIPMIKSKIFIYTLLWFQLFSMVDTTHPAFAKTAHVKQIKPIEISVLNETREALKLLDAPEDKLELLTKACYSAGFANDIDPVLIATIIKPESNFDIDAVSKKGYKSLMGTKTAVMNWTYAPSNIMLGACVLREKLNQYKTVEKAMIFYKGKGGKDSQKFAKLQISLYKQIKTKIKTNLCKSPSNQIILAELM